MFENVNAELCRFYQGRLCKAIKFTHCKSETSHKYSVIPRALQVHTNGMMCKRDVDAPSSSPSTEPAV